MSFSDRSHIFRKSDPGQKNKEKKDHNNNTEQESTALIKRRGASLARNEFNRQNSLNSSAREQTNKRNSVFDPAKYDSGSTSGTKLINFFKSGLHLSKFKSKSKVNLQEKRQSLYTDVNSSKSEENIMGLELESYVMAISASSLVLNDYDPTLYTNTVTADRGTIYKVVEVLDPNECSVQSVHSSIVGGQNHCFQIVRRKRSEISDSRPFHSINVNTNSFTASQITKSCSYNSPFLDSKPTSKTSESVNIIRCSSAMQRNEWIMKIKKHMNPNFEHTIRHEDILKIWIQDAKNLLPKKRYFCEIRLDQILYGRTTIKVMNDMVFWGEEFEFTGLENVSVISVSIYRMVELKRKKDKSELIALISLPCSEVLQNAFTEKWYSPSPDIRASSDHLKYSHSKSLIINTQNLDDVSMKCIIDSTPMLRIKARYRPLEIIPINCYQPLIDYILADSTDLVMALENHLKVKSKEELVNTLILILQKKHKHVEFLSEVMLTEVLRADDNLILRGNSMASKAMECYLKIIGEKYLFLILSDIIDQISTQETDCEVDPLKIQNLKDNTVILTNQNKLLMLVESVWFRICNSSHLMPDDLKSVFSIIRERMATNRLSSCMIEQVISSCLFLRFICPAIMSPFLFGLSSEYSDKSSVNRTFTLVAKCIQSLANFSQSYTGKEAYMGFLHEFLISKAYQMHCFLKEISSSNFNLESNGINDDKLSSPDDSVDLGYQLAELTYQLSFHLRGIPTKDYSPALTNVRSILEGISKRFPTLDNDKRDIRGSLPTFSDLRGQSSASGHRLMPMSSSVNQLLDRKPSTLSSIKCSPISRRDEEENFSYYPNSNSSLQAAPCDGFMRPSNENYVDFECIDLSLYDEPFIDREEQSKLSLPSKVLNEKEINEHWNEVLMESYGHVTPIDSCHYDSINCTINSSGYESLNYPPNIPSDTHTLHSSISYIEDQSCGLSRQSGSQKMAPARQPNIYRRIKRTTNVLNPSIIANESRTCEQSKPTSPNLSLSLTTSSSTLGSLDNAYGSENNGLKTSKSMSSVFQKKRLHDTPHQLSFSRDHTNGDFYKSQENIDSSMMKLFRNSSKSISNSISSNIDLDSFVTNELIRLQLFCDYFDVQRPSAYQGNAVEQYKRKTLDENNLRRVLVKKGHLNRSDITNHIKSSYRLLRTLNNPGQISTECLIKSVMLINGQVQNVIRNEFLQLHGPPPDINHSPTKVPSTQHSISMSTQSLPPFTKYSKQSPTNTVTYSISPSSEWNSSVNLSKSLTVHDVFHRY